MGNPVLLDLAEGQQFLAGRDLALDHPVERAAIQDLVRTLGCHPRYVNKLGFLALDAFFLEPFLLPVGKFRKAVAADA